MKPEPAPRSPTATPTPAGEPSAAPRPTSEETPAVTPGETPAPEAAPSEGVEERPSATATPETAGSGTGDGRSGPPSELVDARVPTESGGLGIGIGGLGVLDGVEIWIVPAATIGVPGLLLLIWIGLQAVGAFAWVPAIRRLRGDEPT